MLLSWDEARQECSYRGGYRRDGELASINTREEQTFMQSTSQPATTNHHYLQSLHFDIVVALQNYLCRDLTAFPQPT